MTKYSETFTGTSSLQYGKFTNITQPGRTILDVWFLEIDTVCIINWVRMYDEAWSLGKSLGIRPLDFPWAQGMFMKDNLALWLLTKKYWKYCLKILIISNLSLWKTIIIKIHIFNHICWIIRCIWIKKLKRCSLRPDSLWPSEYFL